MIAACASALPFPKRVVRPLRVSRPLSYEKLLFAEAARLFHLLTASCKLGMPMINLVQAPRGAAGCSSAAR